jgi:anti-sigma regulatory factor (Ser/Thr protein kinase)
MNDLSLHIIDIIQNSISAGATLINVTVDENIYKNSLTICIDDNGKGMTKDQISRLDDPFFTSRTTRRVGMGIPLFRQSAQQSGGDLVVESEPGKGTVVTAKFINDHLDRPPLGDIANTMILMVSSNPQIDFLFKYLFNDQLYIFDTVEVKEVLEGLPLNDPAVIRMLTEMISENIRDLKTQSD